MSTKPKSAQDRSTFILAAAWFIAYWVARGLLENTTLGRGVRIAVAVFPVPVFAAFLISYIKMIRSLDELERRIHLEGLAIAFSLATLLLMTLGLLQRAVTLPFQDWSYAHVWIYLPMFYFVSALFVARRYQAE